jgi:hypothetical protein
MAKVFVQDSTLTSIANAIREKDKTENLYKPSEMAAAIKAIKSQEELNAKLLIRRGIAYLTLDDSLAIDIADDYSLTLGNTLQDLSKLERLTFADLPTRHLKYLYDFDDTQNGPFYGSGKNCIINFPESLKTIGDKMFYGMDFAADTLSKLPLTLTSIGDYAFAYTESRNGFTGNYVDEIVIPATVTDIGKYAFNKLQVKDVYFRGTPTSIGAQAFNFDAPYQSDGTRLQTNIYVPWAEGAGPSLGVVNNYTTIHYNYK